jgi:hypothetical protein
MRVAASRLLSLFVLIVAATMLVAGYGKDDSIAKAEKKDAAKGVAAPSIAETKAIAEEGLHLRPADRDELRGHVRDRDR